MSTLCSIARHVHFHTQQRAGIGRFKLYCYNMLILQAGDEHYGWYEIIVTPHIFNAFFRFLTASG